MVVSLVAQAESAGTSCHGSDYCISYVSFKKLESQVYLKYARQQYIVPIGSGWPGASLGLDDVPVRRPSRRLNFYSRPCRLIIVLANLQSGVAFNPASSPRTSCPACVFIPRILIYHLPDEPLGRSGAS